MTRGWRVLAERWIGRQDEALEESIRRHPAGRARTAADEFLADRSTRYSGTAARLAASGWSLEESRRAADSIDRLVARLELPPLTPWQRLVLEDLGVRDGGFRGAWVDEVVDWTALEDDERLIAEQLRQEVDDLEDTPCRRAAALLDMLALLAGSYLSARVATRVAIALALVAAVALGASGCKGTNPATPVTGTAPAPAAPAATTEG